MCAREGCAGGGSDIDVEVDGGGFLERGFRERWVGGRRV